MIEIIVSLALILIGIYAKQLLLTLLGFALLVYLIIPKKQPGQSNKEAPVGARYKHRVLNSEAPASMTLTPAEMSAPFFPMMQADLDKQKADEKKGKDMKVDLDAFPIFRGNPMNPVESFFSMLPFDMFKRTKIKKKDKAGVETETSLFEKRD